MEKLTMFYLEHCPYCRNARKALAELQAEHARYAAVPVELVEESEEPERADRYDYYRVPTIFLGGRKLYEAVITDRYEDIRHNVQAALDAALETE